ncbi:MAG: zinc-ribbon domain-containing protein [bacterium]|nr:zinc-ribbon domain-containing protein [bacterium]
MQYCKNCGRQLKEGTRFCDRCGTSVRQSGNSEVAKKQKQIEKLQRERLERKKRQEELDAIEKRKKARRQEKRRKQNKVLILIAACAAVIVVVAVISFIATTMTSKDELWKNNVPIGGLSSDALPTMQPSVTAEPATEPPRSEKDNYSVYELSNGVRFSSPKSFTEETPEDGEELRFLDDNGAEIRVYMIEYPGGTVESLMKRFADSEVGKVNSSLAGSDWYLITIQDDDIIKHRKYIIDRENDLSVYYDFEFDSSLPAADEYEDNMDYMSENFTLPKANKADDERE